MRATMKKRKTKNPRMTKAKNKWGRPMPTDHPRCHICDTLDSVRARQFRPQPILLCDGCHKLATRKFNKHRGRQRDREVATPARSEWIETLRSAWDANGSCFRCMISGVPLRVDDPASPRYPTLEHTAPGTGHGGWLVVAAAINDMKSDFGLDEFKALIRLLARTIEPQGEAKAAGEIQVLLDGLKHWRRVKVAMDPEAIPVEETD